jgi:hypothetical protein
MMWAVGHAAGPEPVPRLPWAGVCARRLERQSLTAPRAVGSPADVTAAMCGAHAQVLTAAGWSIGLRLDGVTQDDVRAALWSERSLVKTFGPRGTVHLLPAGDLPLWTAALSAVPVTFPAVAGVRLAPEQAEAVIAAIGDALLGAELTQPRPERHVHQPAQLAARLPAGRCAVRPA